MKTNEFTIQNDNDLQADAWTTNNKVQVEAINWEVGISGSRETDL